MKTIADIAFKAVCLILITLCLIFSIKAYNKANALNSTIFDNHSELRGQIAYIEWELDVCSDASTGLLYLEGISENTIDEMKENARKVYFDNFLGVPYIATKSFTVENFNKN